MCEEGLDKHRGREDMVRTKETKDRTGQVQTKNEHWHQGVIKVKR